MRVGERAATWSTRVRADRSRPEAGAAHAGAEPAAGCRTGLRSIRGPGGPGGGARAAPAVAAGLGGFNARRTRQAAIRGGPAASAVGDGRSARRPDSRCSTRRYTPDGLLRAVARPARPRSRAPGWGASRRRLAPAAAPALELRQLVDERQRSGVGLGGRAVRSAASARARACGLRCRHGHRRPPAWRRAPRERAKRRQRAARSFLHARPSRRADHQRRDRVEVLAALVVQPVVVGAQEGADDGRHE